MPTIEIASINAKELGLKQADFGVAIMEEKELQSHRGLFHHIFQQYNGAIIHIGNPELRNQNDGGFFAGNIIDWSIDSHVDLSISEVNMDEIGANRQFLFKFLSEIKPDIDRLLKIALEKSPIKRVLFLTDYQFGPEKAQTEIIYSVSAFWSQHDNDGLRFNTLYEMYSL